MGILGWKWHKMKFLKQIKIAIVLILGSVGLLLTSHVVQAAKQTGNFLIYPELPKDNIGGYQTGYYNLKNRPHQTQTVRVKLINLEAHDVKVTAKVADAVTTNQGSVDYSGVHQADPRWLKNPGSQYIEVPKTTVLKPHETKWLTAQVKMPAQFTGRKASALVLSSQDIKASQKSGVRNHYVYAVGLTLNGRALKTKQVQKLQVQKVRTRMVDRKAAITTTLVNPDPQYVKKAHLKIELVNQRWRFYRYRLDRKAVELAPNSQMAADLYLGGRRLVPGIYQMRMTVKSQQYQQTVTKTVKITKTAAYLINTQNAAWQKRKYWLIAGGVTSGLLIIGLVTIVVTRRRRLLR